jgi:hypothetical protein
MAQAEALDVATQKKSRRTVRRKHAGRRRREGRCSALLGSPNGPPQSRDSGMTLHGMLVEAEKKSLKKRGWKGASKSGDSDMGKRSARTVGPNSPVVVKGWAFSKSASTLFACRRSAMGFSWTLLDFAVCNFRRNTGRAFAADLPRFVGKKGSQRGPRERMPHRRSIDRHPSTASK